MRNEQQLIAEILEFRKTAKALSTSHTMTYQQFLDIAEWLRGQFDEFRLEFKSDETKVTIPL